MKCLVSDSASVNLRLAKLLKTPIVNCLAHLWIFAMKALTFDEYMFYDRELDIAIIECRQTTKRQLAYDEETAKARLPVENRWTSNYSCVKCVNENLPFLHKAIAVNDCPKRDPTIGSNIPNFQSVVSRLATKLCK